MAGILYYSQSCNLLRIWHFLVLWVGKVELSIILCFDDGGLSGDTVNIPNDVADIVEKHSLVPFRAKVRGSCSSI